MAFDTSKLVKLAALQSLATKVATDYALKSDLTTLQETVQGIVSTGGKANVLEGVKVNGTALTIAEKIVNLLIATGTTNGTLAVNGVDVAIKGLAALAYKAEISQDDLDTALSAVIAAKASQSDLTALTNLVGTLPDDIDATTVVGYISESVAAGIADVVAGADTSFDTLKEIADWIASDTTGTASMNSAIQTNATNITALNTLIGAIPEDADATTVIGYIAEAIAAITVTASTTNGNIKIDGVETTVYTLPETTLDSTDNATDAEVAEMLADVFSTSSDE